MYEVAWSKRSLKSLQRIAQKDAQKIYLAVQVLREWPVKRNVVKLTGTHDGYRLRVGRYRILFEVDDVVRIIFIEDVKKRDERTY